MLALILYFAHNFYMVIKNFFRSIFDLFTRDSFYRYFIWFDGFRIKVHNQLEYSIYVLKEFFNIKVLAY